MQTKGKFILMNLQEFEGYIANLDLTGLRKITHIQNHHTWSPSYRNFNGTNHFAKLENMEADHIARKFGQIAQHFTTFPDGTIAACRPMSLEPTCIRLHNTGGICIENLGNFDIGADNMTADQQYMIVQLNALLCFKFNLVADITDIVYHHWFKQSTGVRDGGKNDPQLKDHKTCPGTAFFGGNTETAATLYFIPAVQEALDAYMAQPPQTDGPVVIPGIVNAEVLNIRGGPGTGFGIVGTLKRGAEVLVLKSEGEWDCIGDNRWVRSDFIALTPSS